MDRIYTDARFPDCRIINDGSTQFKVCSGDRTLQSFVAFDRHSADAKMVTEAFARQISGNFYDRWWSDRNTEPDWLRSKTTGERRESHVFSENTAGEIDRLLRKYRMELKEEHRKTLHAKIVHLMQNENSVASVLVQALVMD